MSKDTAVIGDYEVERELGRGAFGVVYRAHRKSTPDTPVALKVIKGQGNTDRLLLEPAVLSKLEHPCIVGLEDYFLQGDDLVLALEYIDGVDLKQLLDQGQQFTEADVRDLLTQIGSALAAAHARNILHRDIKPANILVTRLKEGSYRFVLTDFGIGQVREGIQREKQAGGTFLFMAPEQLRGRPGPQSDLWALGVVAYRMLTGVQPFPGPTIGELSRQILYGAARPPSAVPARPVDPDLERAVMGLLDKSLAERTASAEVLLTELGYRGPATSVLESRAAKARTARGGESLDRRLEKGIRLRRVLLILAILFYLISMNLLSGVLSAAGLWLFYQSQRRMSLGLLSAAYACLLGAWIFTFKATFLSLFAVVAELFGPMAGHITLFVSVILNLCIPIIAGAQFVQLRRLQREKVLRDLAIQGDAGSEEYLETLRKSLESRYEDVGLHLKYTEALFIRGRVVEAVAEARLLLRTDAYNFNGNLLLANAYQSLGLDGACVEVCEEYLKVSGYCFEFAELRDQCMRRMQA
jgi:serine/threonine protein kinase